MPRHHRRTRRRATRARSWWRAARRGNRRTTTAIAAAVVAAIACMVLTPGQPGRLIDTLTGAGGPQPASVLTAGAHTYTAVDLAPPVTQRRHLNGLRDKLAALGLGDNPTGGLFQLLARHTVAAGAQWPDQLDTSWVGPRMLAAAYPPDPETPDGPRQVLAVRTSDPAAADTALTALREAVPGQRLAWRSHGDYMIIAASDSAVASLTAPPGGKTLADDTTIRSDLAKLDNRPVLAGWADLAAVNRDYPGGLPLWRAVPWLTEALYGQFGVHGTGRIAVAGVAEPGGLRITLWSSTLADVAASNTPPAGGGPALIRYAPRQARFAAHVHGGAAILLDQWPALMAANPMGLPAQIAATGVTVPDDLAAAVGNETMYAAVTGPDGITDWVARSRTPHPHVGFQAARVLAETVLAAIAPMRTPSVRPVDGGVLVATTADLAQHVSDPQQPSLDATAEFQAVLPDVDRAQAAFYYDTVRHGHRLVVGGQLRPGGRAVIRIVFPAMSGDTRPSEPDQPSPADGQQLPVGPTPISRASLPPFAADQQHIINAIAQADALIADRDQLTTSWPAVYRTPLHEHATELRKLLAGEFTRQFTNGSDPAANERYYIDVMAAVARYADQVAVIGWWHTHAQQWANSAYWDRVETVIAEQRVQGKDATALDAAATALRDLGPRAARDIAPYLEALAATDPRHTHRSITAGTALANAPVANLADVLAATAIVDGLFTAG